MDNCTQDISDLINSYFLSSTPEQKRVLLSALGSALQKELFASLDEIHEVHYAGRIYTIKKDRDRGQKLIAFHQHEKDFNEAVNELWCYFFEILNTIFIRYDLAVLAHPQVAERYQTWCDINLSEQEQTIIKGLHHKTDRTSFIRNSFGLILNNRIFNDVINDYRRRERYAFKQFKNDIAELAAEKIFSIIKRQPGIADRYSDSALALFAVLCEQTEDIATADPDKWFSTAAQGDVFEAIRRIIPEGISEGQISALCKDVSGIKKEVAKSYASSPDRSIKIDQDDYADSPSASQEKIDRKLYADDLFSHANQLDQIVRHDLQQKHFFWEYQYQDKKEIWKEGLPDFIDVASLEKLFEIPACDKPILVAFFYTWLMTCSGLTKQQIANICKVNPSTVTRWSPPLLLRYPFIDNEDVFPVFLTAGARRQLGLKNADRQPEGEKKKKDALWELYKFLCDANSLDEIDKVKMGAEAAPKGQPAFQICYNTQIKELDEDNSSRFYLFVIIDRLNISGAQHGSAD